jgi:hypothetical protein
METQGFLRLVAAPASDFSLQEEDRSGVKWLVARNYNVRFDATLRLNGEEIALSGVFLSVENAMLPVSGSEVLGYAHGVVSIYDATQTEVFSGPFLNPVVGMRFQDGQVVDYWAQVIGTWSGARQFAGRLLRVSLEGEWKPIDGAQKLVVEGDAILV